MSEKRKWGAKTPEIVEILKVRYPKEGSAKLAAELGVGTTTIGRWAREEGLEMENPEVNRSQRKRDAAHVTGDCFNTWTAESAYYLGYIWADGSIQTGRHSGLWLECQLEDRQILEGLRTYLGSNHKITERHRDDKRGFTSHGVQLVICGHTLVENLQKHGIQPNKSNLDLPYPEVPDEWAGHFMRGFLDGDGSVSVAEKGPFGKLTLSFMGSKNFIAGLNNHLVKLTGIIMRDPYFRVETKTVWVVKWSAHDDLVKLKSLLYPVGVYPFLLRKRVKLSSYLFSKAFK